jgi:hypothetical protein
MKKLQPRVRIGFPNVFLLSFLFITCWSCKEKPVENALPEEKTVLLKKITWSEKDFITQAYNDQGQPTRYTSQWVSSPDGHVSSYIAEFLYDAKHKLVRVEANQKLLVKYVYQGDVLQKTEEYDHKDRLVVSHTYSFDASKRLTQVLDHITDPLDGTAGHLKKTYAYDNRGNLLTYREYHLQANTQTYELQLSYNYEGYDDQKSPNELSLIFPHLPQIKFQVNNPSKRTILLKDGSVKEEQTYSYQYRVDGYPSSKTTHIRVGTRSTTYTGTYEYQPGD